MLVTVVKDAPAIYANPGGPAAAVSYCHAEPVHTANRLVSVSKINCPVYGTVGRVVEVQTPGLITVDAPNTELNGIIYLHINNNIFMIFLPDHALAIVKEPVVSHAIHV
jgi:hypothetical protein